MNLKSVSSWGLDCECVDNDLEAYTVCFAWIMDSTAILEPHMFSYITHMHVTVE